MKLPRIFGSRKPSAEDIEMQRQAEASDAEITQLNGSIRDNIQVFQSQARVLMRKSKRMQTMARTMALVRDGVSE